MNTGKINKLPFLFLFNRQVEIQEMNDKEVIIENQKSNIKKANLILIAILKYLPFVFVLAMLDYSHIIEDVNIIAVSILIFASLVLIFKFARFMLVPLLIGILILNAFLIFNFNISFEMELTLYYLCIVTLLSFIIFDIYIKGYDNYYYLENAKTNIQLKKDNNEKSFKFLFKDKKSPLNIKFNINFPIYGYFIKVQK